MEREGGKRPYQLVRTSWGGGTALTLPSEEGGEWSRDCLMSRLSSLPPSKQAKGLSRGKSGHTRSKGGDKKARFREKMRGSEIARAKKALYPTGFWFHRSKVSLMKRREGAHFAMRPKEQIWTSDTSLARRFLSLRVGLMLAPREQMRKEGRRIKEEKAQDLPK